MISHFLDNLMDNLLPYLFLYTELHYKFKFLGSRYFIKEPEILLDVPHRIEPKHDIPLFLLIKDSHWFPIKLIDIKIEIVNNQINDKFHYNFDKSINQKWWSETLYISSSNYKQNIEIKAFIKYEINGQIKTSINHNIPTIKPTPLNSFVSSEVYPRPLNTIYGDLHYHTNVTDDMVEFGAPLDSTYKAMKPLALDFACNTDHSYDIDDKIDSWIETDPELSKWNNSIKEINLLNEKNHFNTFFIQSEELSLHNLDGYIIHALVLNNKKFLPGQGDGAEIPFDFSCKYNTLTLKKDLEKNSLCIAAHPQSPVPFLQKIFFKRGQWLFKDLILDHIDGLQILNGEIDTGFINGLKIWKKLILSGYKKFIYAGNDAHGNFNKYRQIKIPMISILEKDSQIFGECRTGIVRVNNKTSIESTIRALKHGNCFVTNGPAITINVFHENINYHMGDSIISDRIHIKLTFSSNKELGKKGKIIIYFGEIGFKEKQIFYDIDVNDNELIMEFPFIVRKKGYIRAEFSGDSYRGKRIALTNPIWVNPLC